MSTMHTALACELLKIPATADSEQIKSAYITQINLAEDAIDDALDSAAEDAAWQHYKQLQQARSLLLKALKKPLDKPVATKATASSQLGAQEAPLVPLTADSAYALLGLSADADQEQIQQAYQQQLEQLDNAIDRVESPSDAEPLWEQHKRIQQARYLLLHTRTMQKVEQHTQQYSKKLLQACAELGVNADSLEQDVRRRYNQKISELEEQIDSAASAQQADRLWEQQRKLQRAFSIFINALAEPASTQLMPPVSSSASLDDFLKQQQRHRQFQFLFRLLLLCVLAIGVYMAWQKGYVQQAKDWLIPPLSAEQQAVKIPVLELQEQVVALHSALQAGYEDLRLKALDAARKDSPDYPRFVRLRNRFEKIILHSKAFNQAKNQQERAAVSIEQQDYITAEEPLLSARSEYQGLQLKAEALRQGKQPKIKRRIPSAPKKTASKKQVPQASLPALSAEQQRWTPRLINVPAGQFMMGDSGIEEAQPVHKVIIPAFKMAESELSVKHFRQFVQQTKYQTEAERNIDEKGCSVFSEKSKSWHWLEGSSWKSPGFEQGEEDPVVCLSWADVQAYLNWLRGATGWNVRLASEAEWEYAARAGTTSAWFWGDKLDLERANCEDCNQDWEVRQTFASRAYPANVFGLHSMPGNVWEWTADCWQDSYVGAPGNGQARLNGDCSKRVIRGGSWFSPARDLRSAARNASSRLTYRSSSLGFRVAVSY